jgi:hypothetical protein
MFHRQTLLPQWRQAIAERPSTDVKLLLSTAEHLRRTGQGRDMKY